MLSNTIEKLKSKVTTARLWLLVQHLKSSDDWFRADTARALGESRDPRAVEPLIEALKDENYPVRRAAVKALEAISKPGLRASLYYSWIARHVA
jgi:HEAT repeat protein